MKSFKKKIYVNGSKEDNWSLVEKADKLGFKNTDNFKYLGYEVNFEVELFEDGSNKVLKINGINVSDKNINI